MPAPPYECGWNGEKSPEVGYPPLMFDPCGRGLTVDIFWTQRKKGPLDLRKVELDIGPRQAPQRSTGGLPQTNILPNV